MEVEDIIIIKFCLFYCLTVFLVMGIIISFINDFFVSFYLISLGFLFSSSIFYRFFKEDCVMSGFSINDDNISYRPFKTGDR